MPIKYQVTLNGKVYNLNREKVLSDLDGFRETFKGGTIRMRDNNKKDYDIPVDKVNDAREQGLHTFKWDTNPQAQAQQTQVSKKISTPVDGSVSLDLESQLNDMSQKNRENFLSVTRDPQFAKSYERQQELRKKENKVMPSLTNSAEQVAQNFHTTTPLSEAQQNQLELQKHNLEETDRKADINGTRETLGQMSQKADESINEKFNQDRAQQQQWRDDHPFLAALSDFLSPMGTGGSGTLSPYQYIPDNAKSAIAAKGNIQSTLEDLDEARRIGHTNTVRRTWRGFKRGAGEASSYDLGLSDMYNATALKEAADRYDKGQQTTDDELLMQSAVIANAVGTKYSDALGGAYAAGKSLPETIGYMAEFIQNPASGIGSAAAKKTATAVARYALKKFGKGVASRAVTTLAKGAVRVGVDGLEAGVITGMYDPAKIASDYIDRKTGDVTPDGKGGYIFQNQEHSTLQALGKAITSDYLNNLSEMWGEYLPGGGFVKKGLKKIGLGKLVGAYEHMSSSDWAKSFGKFEERAQWHGLGGEYAEEVMNNIANAAVVGDMTFDTDPNTGVFNKDINLNTLESVALMCGIMSGVKSAGYGAYKYSAGRRLDAADKVAQGLFADKWDGIKAQIDNADEKSIGDVMEQIGNNADLSEEQKKAALDYQLANAYYHGANMQDMKNKLEGNYSSIDNAFDRGYNAKEQQKAEAKRKLIAAEKALRKAAQLKDDDNIDEFLELNKYRENIIASSMGPYTKPTLDYLNAKAEYEGVMRGAQDRIEDKVNESNRRIDSFIGVMRNYSMLRPATMKVDDRPVYIIKGDLSMAEDGTTFDKENSSSSFVIRDAETGKLEQVSIDDILSKGDEIDAEEYKQQEAQRIAQEAAQQEGSEIDGALPFNKGDTYQITDGNGNVQNIQITADNGDGTVRAMQNGQDVTLQKAEIQTLYDGQEQARVEAETEQQQAQQAEAERQQNAVNETYEQEDEVTIRNDNGELLRGTVRRYDESEGGYVVDTEDGRVKIMSADELNNKIEAHNGKVIDKNVGGVSENAGNAGEDGGNVTETEQPVTGTTAETEQPGITTEQPGTITGEEVVPMPMNGKEPDFTKTTPERGHQYIYNSEESGLDKSTADAFVKANVDAANKALEKIKSKKPKIGTSISKFKQDQAKWQQDMEPAQKSVDYWNGVKDIQDKIANAEAADRAAKQAAETEKAIAEEKARKEAEAKAEAERKAVGNENPMPHITEKWNAAPKEEGMEDEITLPNGETITGHYVLTESGAASASHDALNGFSKTDGYPMDENDQSVNDRDYERDKDAQGVTRNIANNYDNRALQTPVVVSNDGVVMSGNGRTMAGELAAMNGTDAAYNEYLKKHAAKYGFAPEQVVSMKHPRVLFVPNDAMPYTAETFAKFNQQEMKSQSKTEQAVKLGKVVDDGTFNRIVRSINEYETLGDFYNDSNATHEAIKELVDAGVITNAQVAEMFDGDTLSAHGREILENTLIGKAFENNPDAVREITKYKSMRQSVITALSEIINNKSLGSEYSLESELAQAIELVYNARNDGYDFGSKVSEYARQGNLFQLDDDATVADYTNATVMMLADVLNDMRSTRLKKIISSYNKDASDSAAGQLDIFSGDIESKQEILKDVLKIINNGTETKQTTGEKPKANSIQQNGNDGKGDEGNGHYIKLNEDETDKLISLLIEKAELAKNLELSPDAWEEEFGETGIVETPIGNVKMGENQYLKLLNKKRNGYFGMIKPTLTNPDIILEEYDPKEGAERDTKYLFVKTFVKADGSRIVHFESVTVQKDNLEVSISSHEIEESTLIKKVHQDKLMHLNDKFFNSERHLIEPQSEGSDLVPAPNSISSEGKDTKKSETPNKKEEKFIQNHPSGSIEDANDKRMADIESRLSDIDSRRMEISDALNDEESDHTNDDALYTEDQQLVNEKNDLESEYKGLKETQATSDAIAKAEKQVETNPTDGQKEAGNYKKGHVTVDGYDLTIENPKGSVRSGRDSDGEEWHTEMHNTYGYIRGTEGVDGDHIDVYLSDDPTKGNVYVVDQANPKTGEFDEHKVMYGFPDAESAKQAYLSNYAKDWKGLGHITEVSKDEFKKWINSSKRKTKPFSEYKSINATNNLDKFSLKFDEIQNMSVGTKSEIDQKYQELFALKAQLIKEFGTSPKQGAALGLLNSINEEFHAIQGELLDLKPKPETEPEKKENPSGNKLVTDERYAELKKRMLDKMRGQLNIGIDPEILAIGTEMAVYHIEKGARKFAEFAKVMIADLGDAIRPYLKSFYNGARDLPEMEELSKEMDSYDTVSKTDVTKPDANVLEKAEAITEEIKATKDAAKAKEKVNEKINSNISKAKRNNNKKKNVSSQQDTADLFGDLKTDNNEKQEENGLQRNDEQGTGGLPADNGRLDADVKGEVRQEAQQESGGTDGGRREGNHVGQRPLRPGLHRLENQNKNNNHSERGVDYAPKGVDARIEANFKAIELMQQLIESGEKATPEQMKVLRQYSGWGGLGKAFNEKEIVYGLNNKSTAQRLRELLGDEAYEQANMSRNSAYYTPAKVIDSLWDIAKALGFKGGNILEGSAGIGNIIGAMPKEISDSSSVHAVEIDSTSGNILSLLYPDAKVEVQGFEQTQIPNGSVDLAITNVPFVTGLRVNDTTGDKDLSKKFHDIHDFCIAKNIRKLRAGGVGIFITSSGTMDNSKALRDWIVGEGGADVIGAFRMNNKTFGGTGATSDIIIVRKRVNGQKSQNAINVSDISGERSTDYDTGDTKKIKGKETPIIKHLSMDYNKYFIEHPEMMGGVMHFGFEEGDTFRPTSKALYPDKDVDQDKRLAEFSKHFEDMEESEQPERREEPTQQVYESLGKDVKEGSMVVGKNGKLCIAQFGKAVPLQVNDNKVKGHTKKECFEAYSAIKKALSDVLKYQTGNNSDEELKPLLAKLNKAYDDFVNTYGHLNKNTSISFLKNDVDYPSILALETYSESEDIKGNKKETFGKTDVFKQRVVEKEKEPEPKNVKDGIISSIYEFGRVDVPYIASHLNKSESEVKEEIIKSGLGFENPNSKQIEVSYEYLSGNVREKLRQAQANNTNGEYDANIKALEKVIPMDIPAHLIDFTLGSSWIDPKLYNEYVKERTGIDVRFTSAGGTWFMDAPEYGLNVDKNRTAGVFSEQFHETILGHQLMEAAIQNKTITVSKTYKHYDGTSETVTDKDATQACSTKIDEIRQDFKEWARQKMQNDPEMSATIERTYNDQFNNSVPKSIPDDFVPEHFGGAAKVVEGREFKLRPHQGKAVVRGTTQPLLLAHEVGTGKTYTLISIAMEMRRLGTARKPMIVVQNATVGQFVSSAKKLYPNAKVLTLEDADRNAEGRKNFYAKIKYNDWDMIVVPQSVFERIPDSEERQMAFIKDKIDEKMTVLEEMKEADPDGKSIITRQAEKEIETLKAQMADLSTVISDKRKEKDAKKTAVTRQNAEVKAREMLDRETDDVENFDDMGIDAVLVDEAHEYKHLGFATAMQRGVKGVDPSYSKKSQGVYLKTQAVLEKNNGRNVIFATGTPISNTAAEIWTFMRYLMPANVMKDYGIFYFDDFVRNFGSIQQLLEFTTSGKYKENNRFAGYSNLPELVRIWSGIADTVLTREAGGVKIPEMENGKAQDIYLPQTKALRSVMKFVKSELKRYEEMSGKEKKENSYIPLTMYGIAKAAAVDARLVVSDAEDDPNSKTNEAVRQTLRSLKETDSYRGTVAIFADNYQNKESGFNLYEDIKQKLIAQGVPAEKIVIMKSGMSVKKKLEIFDKVNSGEVRVVMGSTFTLGTGVNIQERLHTLIHLDAPNRPMDYTQRNGRILRQGNLHKEWNKPVRVLRFDVEDSLDVTVYQRLKTKGAIADSIMNGKQMMANSMENRSLEEEEDVFGDTVAQLSGSEYAMLKNQAEKDLRKFESKYKQWEADQTYIHNQKPHLQGKIKDSENEIEKNNQRLSILDKKIGKDKPKITIGKALYANIDAMVDFIKDFNKKIKEVEDKIRSNPMDEEQSRKITVNVGGIDFEFKTILSKDLEMRNGKLSAVVRRIMTYSCPELSLKDVPVKQSLLRNGIEDILENVITGDDFKERIEYEKRSIDKNKTELAQITEREGKPFQHVEELKKAKERVDEYSDLMKKEMEEKEKKYAEIDASVKAADNVATASEDEEEDNKETLRFRDNSSLIRGNELPSEIAQDAKDLARKLGVNIEVIEHVKDIQDDDPENKSRKRRAKGWYNLETGKVIIVLPNVRNSNDAKATIFHEIVAHKGLRKLLGEEAFNKFLNDVWMHCTPEIRAAIAKTIPDYDFNHLVATEEYMARLAENGVDDMTMWKRIKAMFYNMLRKAGMNIQFTDNDILYMLWRSKQNLEKNNPLDNAKDIAMQYNLGVGEVGLANENGRFRYRDSIEEDLDNTARTLYDKATSELAFKLREAWQDSMLGLRELQSAIARQTGNAIKEFENAYMAENRMHGATKNESEYFVRKLFKPMLETVNKLCKATHSSLDDVMKYMIYKHGLERNSYYSFMEALRDEAKNQDVDKDNLDAWVAEQMDKYKKDTEHLNNKEDYEHGRITYTQYMEKEDALKQNYAPTYMDLKKDYSGLTETTGTIPAGALDDMSSKEKSAIIKDAFGESESAALAGVDEMETDKNGNRREEIAELWKRIGDVNAATLRKSYESGMMSKDNYKYISGMFDYYIPLRGWAENKAEDVYDFFTSPKPGVFTPTVKTAKGRTSRAENPIAYMGNMGVSGIITGNKNKLKQYFLNMARNHPTNLVTVSEQWYQNMGTDEKPDWVEVSAEQDFDENDDADTIAQKTADFEQKMHDLEEEGKATRVRGRLHVRYHETNSQKREHSVTVEVNGKQYVMYINGNPRAAQALNGTNIERSPLPWLANINRWMATNFTSRNPSFVISNLARDIQFAATSTAIKEDPKYITTFAKNTAKILGTPVIGKKHIGKKASVIMATGMMPDLMRKYLHDELDMSDQTEKYFAEFMKNGGETGFTAILTVDKFAKEIGQDIKRMNKSKLTPMAGLRMMSETMEFYNRCAEDATRFITYLTSRECGRSVDASVDNAKNISLNFNRKGSGKMGNALVRNMFIFVNPSIQALQNVMQMAKHHPIRFSIGAAAMFSMGAVIPLLNAMAMGVMGGDDDKDRYWDLPEWERRNNFCVWLGWASKMVPGVSRDTFLTIPLTQELRSVYGLGEMCTSIASDHNNGSIVNGILSQVSNLLPIDVSSYGDDFNLSDKSLVFAPTLIKPFAELWRNKKFSGYSIYKDTGSKFSPAFRNAKEDTPSWMISASQELNDWTGGNDYKKGMIDINPSVVNHIAQGYMGGLYSFISQSAGAVKTAFSGQMPNVYNIPVVNRLINIPAERKNAGSLNEKYYFYKDQYGEYQYQLSNYKRDADKYVEGADDAYNNLLDSDQYDKYLDQKYYINQINSLEKEEKMAESDEDAAYYKQQADDLKKEMIDVMKTYEK